MNLFLLSVSIACTLCCNVALKAQQQILNDNRGKPLMQDAYIDVDGNPFFTDNWILGTVSFISGKTVNANLKYDVVKDELIYQSKRDLQPLNFTEEIKCFSFDTLKIAESDLLPITFSNGYPAVDEQTSASFYQEIAKGKIQLLKRYNKNVQTNQAFNQSVVIKTVVSKDAVYYLFTNNSITKFKPTRKKTIELMKDKSDKIQSFLNAKLINFKSDADLAKLFNYYNLL